MCILVLLNYHLSTWGSFLVLFYTYLLFWYPFKENKLDQHFFIGPQIIGWIIIGFHIQVKWVWIMISWLKHFISITLS